MFFIRVNKVISKVRLCILKQEDERYRAESSALVCSFVRYSWSIGVVATQKREFRLVGSSSPLISRRKLT
jgi:hypothetical protein